MPEPAEFANGLAVQAAGAEAVECGLRRLQRLDRLLLAARGCKRPSVHEERSRGQERRPGRALACRRARRGRLLRLAPSEQEPCPRQPRDAERPVRPRTACSRFAGRDRGLGCFQIPGGELSLGEVGRRARDLDRHESGQVRAAEGLEQRVAPALRIASRCQRRAHAPTGLSRRVKARRSASLGSVGCVLEGGLNLAGGEQRRGEGTVGPEQHRAVAGQARTLETLLARGHGLLQPPQFHLSGHLLHGEQQLDALATGGGGHRQPAFQVAERRLELSQPMPRPALHPQPGQAGGQLLAAEPPEREVRLVDGRGGLAPFRVGHPD